MFNDLQLPEYQGLQSEGKKTTFMNTDKTDEASGALLGSGDYDRQESEDLQALFKNLSIVNQKNAMTQESQQKVEQIKREILETHTQRRKEVEEFNQKFAQSQAEKSKKDSLMLPNKTLANQASAGALDDQIPIRDAPEDTVSFQYTQTNNGSFAHTNMLSALHKKPSQQSLEGSNLNKGSVINFELTGASKF